LKDEREGFLVTEYLNDVTLLELLENDSKKLRCARTLICVRASS
jgi:hypothetical protein